MKLSGAGVVFAYPHILNEVRVYSHIQTILKHQEALSMIVQLEECLVMEELRVCEDTY